MGLVRHPRHRSTLRAARRHGEADRRQFYGFHQSGVAMVCRESRAVVKRLQRQHPDGRTGFEKREFMMTVLSRLKKTKPGDDPSLIPLIEDGQYLGLHVTSMLRWQEDLFMRAGGDFGERIIDLLLAARDNQIKVISDRHESIYFPSEEYKISAALGWNRKTRLVSLYDAGVWKELGEVSASVGRPWEFFGPAQDPTRPSAERERMVSEELAPLRELWKRENRRRQRAGSGPLKPLPRIDVCLVVTLREWPSRIAFNRPWSTLH